MSDNGTPAEFVKPTRYGTTFRESFENGLLKAVRLYTFNTPISKGKYRLMQVAMAMCRLVPKTVQAVMVDGRRIVLPISPGMAEAVYFLGEYERELSSVVTGLVEPGDVCLDVGANIGLHTTLLANLCGPEGFVHAFEPVPETFSQLAKNVALLDESSHVKLNNIALGDRTGEVTVHTFDELGLGFSSLSDQGIENTSAITCPLQTLDSYLGEQPKERKIINFVKLDIEGAEMMFFKGAATLFRQRVPPIILAEMAAKQTKNFDYLPNDIIEYITARAAYDFYAVDETTGVMKCIEGFAGSDIGANVFCIPTGHYISRVDRIRKRIIQ